jgi:hypothetical protein
MSHYLNDQTPDFPKLKVYLNTDNLHDLPEDSEWGQAAGEAAIAKLLADGFEGIQVWENPLPFEPDDRLRRCGLHRINAVGEAEDVFRAHLDAGDECVTLHVGWGIEDDDEVHALVRDILNASERTGLPAFIETHRATITQDMWRTVQLTKAFPDIRFNADFSHWYCGQEMVYGDFEAKLDFLQPVFDRVGFLHARIAAPGMIQAAIDDAVTTPRLAVGADYLDHFKQMWTRAMAGFRTHAGPGDVLIFAPELLCSKIYYARLIPDAEGNLREDSDRYREALFYLDVAHNCWLQAR